MSILVNAFGEYIEATLSDPPLDSHYKLLACWIKLPANEVENLSSHNVIARLQHDSSAYLELRTNASPTLTAIGTYGSSAPTAGFLSTPTVGTWTLVGALMYPQSAADSWRISVFRGVEANNNGANLAPSTPSGREFSSIRFGARQTESSARWKGYIAEGSVWRPTSVEHAQAIMSELTTKVATAVTVASPVWYRSLKSNATEGIGGGAAVVYGTTTFHPADHPTLSGGASNSIKISPDPASVTVGSTRQFTITRNASAPSGGVNYLLSSNAPSVATVPENVTMSQGQTQVTFNATAVSAGGASITATNSANSSETDSAALTVSAAAIRTLRVRAQADAKGATAVRGSVRSALPGGGTEIGTFTGQSFKSTLVGGEAEMDIPVSVFGGGSLTTSSTPVVSWQGTSASDSPLGSGQTVGSVGWPAQTVVDI
jgi:hypothetical protein